MKLLAQADVVLALGTRLGPFGTLPQHNIDYWPNNAALIQVEANPRRIGLVKQATVGVCGDARAATIEILHRLQTANISVTARQNKAERLVEIKRQKDAWETELDT